MHGGMSTSTCRIPRCRTHRNVVHRIASRSAASMVPFPICVPMGLWVLPRRRPSTSTVLVMRSISTKRGSAAMRTPSGRKWPSNVHEAPFSFWLSIRFHAYGSINLTLDCTNKATNDWKMDELDSSRETKCTSVAMLLRPYQMTAVA